MGNLILRGFGIGAIAVLCGIGCGDGDNDSKDADDFLGRESGRAYYDIEMVPVKGDTFTMGCIPERDGYIDGNNKRCNNVPYDITAYQVTVSSFYIGRYEVTQGLWKTVMGLNNNPSEYNTNDSLPVTNISWNDAHDFIKKLNYKTGKNYRLPTEAEWEFAARGGNKSAGYIYSGNNNIGDVAWYKNNSDTTTHIVCAKQPNELGIHDMSGNVSEWVNDGDDVDYRIIRGCYYWEEEKDCRVSRRNKFYPYFTAEYIGFRLALSP